MSKPSPTEIQRLRAALTHMARTKCPRKEAANGLVYWQCWAFDPSELAQRVLDGGPIYPDYRAMESETAAERHDTERMRIYGHLQA